MQTQHMEVFSSTRTTWQHYPQQHDALKAGRGRRLWLSVSKRNDFFRHWYLMEGEESSTAAILRAPPHVEAIISNGVLRQFPYSKRNHWNSYPSLSPPSLLLLLTQACCSAPSPCPRSLILIIISFSAAVPSSRSYNFKTKNALVMQYVCLTFKYSYLPRLK